MAGSATDNSTTGYQGIFLSPVKNRLLISRFQLSLAVALALGAAAFLFLTDPARIIAAGLAAAIFLMLTAWGVYDLSFQFFGPAVCRVTSEGKKVVLTFDDGPDPIGTPEALKVLARHGVRATFFLVGEKVSEHGHLVASAVRAGHTAANHTHRHAWWTNFLMGRALDREVARAQDAIYKACGKTPAFFRPPVGLSNPHLHKALRKNGLTVIGWDVRSYDLNRTPEEAAAGIVEKARDGSIILLHDRRSREGELEELLERIIPALKEKGFNLVGLDQALGAAAYQESEAL